MILPLHPYYIPYQPLLNMSMSGSSLADAYIMTRIYHKKMNTPVSKTRDATKQSVLDNDDHKTCSKIGCFPTLFKKIHPATSSTVTVSDSSFHSSQ